MITAEEIAHSLGTSGKSLRTRLRKWYPNHAANSPWEFTQSQAEEVKRRYRDAGSGSFTPSPPSNGTGQCAPASAPPPRPSSDESYVLDLCDALLGERASRQHRFAWLAGDHGKNGVRRSLPVDGYYAKRHLVVEYRERQHTEATPFFDKPDKLTVSGVHRGEQRRLYDRRREIEIPANGLRLVVVSFSDLACDGRGRLRRDKEHDSAALAALLA